MASVVLSRLCTLWYLWCSHTFVPCGICGAYAPFYLAVSVVQVHQVPLHAVAHAYKRLGAKERRPTGEEQTLLNSSTNTTLSASYTNGHRRHISQVSKASYWVSSFPCPVKWINAVPCPMSFCLPVISLSFFFFCVCVCVCVCE